MAEETINYGSIADLVNAPGSPFVDNPELLVQLDNALAAFNLTESSPVQLLVPDPVTGQATTNALPGTVYEVKAGSENVFFARNANNEPIVIVGGPNSTITLKNGVEVGTNGLNAAAGAKAAFTVIETGGDNKVTINKGPSQVISTIGNDTIRSTGGKDTIIGGSGQDSITAGGKSLVIAGSTGDTVHGGLKATARDTIYATGGADTIYVSHGKNLIVGSTGADYLQAGDGSDTIYGGVGKNTIYGGGATTIESGKRNTIHLTGSDVLDGSSGPNTVFSADGGQYIQGNAGKLTIHLAKTADDTIFGGSGHDIVKIAQSSANITHEKTSDNVTSITFKGGQTLQVENVTVVFTDKTKHF